MNALSISPSFVIISFFYFLPDSWDCVVTCYFIDTAHNVIAYIENISKILKPGGYWINLGKLKAIAVSKLCENHYFVDVFIHVKYNTILY